MPLTTGTRLGPYEIVGPLGAGGMGEVYRARDTKLGRDVAIKLLPEAFAQDPDRLARFEREAKTLASLNHPHIAAIYGVEESAPSTGSGQAGVRALVLELVEGPTLADRIAHGPIPVDDALPIARQIAEALEAAHEHGIVHRDLKPANVKVRPDGTVKVLDFGLAKAMEGSGVAHSGVAQDLSPAAMTNSPTITSPAMPFDFRSGHPEQRRGVMTGVGMILGTAAYMAPEQARGKAVDTRADIWAFGCVLYEMLTGRPAFGGDDVQDTLSRVLQREPDWALLPPNVPPQIRELLRLCLEKNPKSRRQAAGDVRIDIERALAEPVTAMPAAAPARHARVAWLVAAGLSIAVLTLAIPTVLHFRETPVPNAREMRTEIVTPTSGDPFSFALSPDGQKLVFVASADGPPRLWLRPLATPAAHPLAGTENAVYPFWSPDSRSVGFFADGKLKRIDLSGGQPLTLANAPAGRGGTWNSDGVILFQPTTGGSLWRVPASGGEATVITKADARQGSHQFPHFLPDGRQFLFYAVTGPDQGIYLGSLDAPQSKRLAAADAAGLYAPPGWLLFVRQGTLMAQRFDPSRGELMDDPVTLADRVFFGAPGRSAVSVSTTGLIAYRTGGARRPQLTWFDRSGKVLTPLGTSDENSFGNPDLSPDGQRVAANSRAQDNVDVWISDGARTTRFTFDASGDSQPIWSPDGTRIVFTSNRRKSVGDLYQKPSSGAGREEPLLESPGGEVPSDWSPDGHFILYYVGDDKEGTDLWVLPLEGTRKPVVFLKTRFNEGHGKFSPDGRWVAYASDESGRFEIYVRPFPGPGGQWQVSTSGGIQPQWRRDGRELYYVAPDGRLMAVPIAAQSATFESGPPVALFPVQIIGLNRQEYDVAPEGRFLINTVVGDEASSPITLIQNWKPPVERP